MFTVILAVVALTDYVIIFYCIVVMAVKPAVEAEKMPKYFPDEPEETPEDTSGEGVMEYISDDKEFNDYIEEQNARIALLSNNVDEILSNIDSIIQGKKYR